MSRLSELSSFPLGLALALTPSFAHATCTQENIVRAGAVADATTGEILLSHGNVDTKFHPASLTKIVSTLVVLESIRNGHMSLNQQITVASSQDGYGGDKLTTNTVLSLENALRASSASQNGIYIAMARAYSGGESAFIRRMNEIARLAGAENTNFINPNGLFLFNVSQNCAGHHTTIRDLFRILHYAQREYPNEMRQYFGQPRIEYNSTDPNAVSLPLLHPTSALLADRDAIAARENIIIDEVKTGYIRYSAAHIMASAHINGHRIYGIETGMEQGASTENRWYRIRDMALLNSFRRVRDEFIHVPMLARYQPYTSPISSKGQTIRVTFSGVNSFASIQREPMRSSPAPERDNFLPVSMRPQSPQSSQSSQSPREQVADILPANDPAPVTLEM